MSKRTVTKFQTAVDYLRNHLDQLNNSADTFPLTIASRTTWLEALRYVRDNPQLHQIPRRKSKYFNRSKLTKGKIIGVVTNWDKLEMAIAAYRLAGYYEQN